MMRVTLAALAGAALLSVGAAVAQQNVDPRNLSSRHSAIAQTFVTMGDGHESRGFAGAPDG